METTSPSKLYSIDGERLRLNFHPAQLKAWNSTARFVFMLAGTQGGKTSFGVWWLYREIMQQGRGDYLAVTSSYDLYKLKMLPEILEVFEHILGVGRYWRGDKVLEIANPETGAFEAQHATDQMWARVILRSAVAKGGLESTTARGAWLDEVGQDEFTLEAWEAVRRRLSLSRGRVLGTTTLYNAGWLKQQIYDRFVMGDPDIDIIQFASVENPAFPREEFESAQTVMAAWKFAMQYEGKYAKPHGLIYRDFVDLPRELGGHVVTPFEIPPSWKRWVGIDPGGANVAKLWIAKHPDELAFYLYRESLTGDKTTPQHAQEIKDYREPIEAFYIGAPSETQIRRDYGAAGISATPPPISDVEAGIDRVIAMWKTSRLFVFETCYGLRDEIGRYSRVLDTMGEVTDVIQDKSSFHRLDALRYLIGGIIKGEPVTTMKVTGLRSKRKRL